MGDINMSRGRGTMTTIFRYAVWLVVFLALATGHVAHADKNLHIALLLWRGETEAEQGFKEELQALGYTVQYTVKNAEQNQQTLGQLLQYDIVPSLHTFDYLYTFGTTVSQITKAIIKNQAPQIFNIVTDPVGAGIVKDLQASGGNISGTTSNIPLTRQIAVALQILPFQRLGFFFNPREKNAMLVRQQLQEIAQQWHFDVVDLRSPPAEDMLHKNLQQLVEKSIVVDAIYLPPDSYMVSHASLIGAQLRAAKLPSIGSVQEFVEHGALVGVVADYAKLGRAAARIVHRHQHGEQLQQIPVQTDEAPVVLINKTSSALLNLSIPDAVLKEALVVEER
jgi:putative tryptophan/tyrosine transport system substrate-binding protein